MENDTEEKLRLLLEVQNASDVNNRIKYLESTVNALFDRVEQLERDLRDEVNNSLKRDANLSKTITTRIT